MVKESKFNAIKKDYAFLKLSHEQSRINYSIN